MSGRARRVGVGLAAAWLSFWLIMERSEFGRSLDFWLTSRISFHIRAALGKSPPISPRLKIFGYDDLAVGEFQNSEITLGDWAKLFRAMGARKPRAILVDKMFSFIPAQDVSELDATRAALIATPIVSVGASLHENVVRAREKLDLARNDYRLEAFTAHPDDAAWLKQKVRNAYGPSAALASAFRHVGHLNYPGDGRVEPFSRFDGGVVVPHMAIFAAENVRIVPDGLELNGRKAPVDRDGFLPVNFSTPSQYFQATFSMKSTLAKVHRGDPLTQIDPGDTVLILPLLYTGNHDEYETPLGRMPGGFINAAIINSILGAPWLAPVGGGPFFIFVAGIAGLFIGLLLRPRSFWPALATGGAAIVGGGLLSFCYGGLIVPWLFPSLGFAGTGVCGFAIRMSEWMRDNRKLTEALQGTIPESKLQAILTGKGRVSLKASERIVTLMFLDIANFSLVAEQSPPKDVFLLLKEILREVTDIIHRYGGTVDKTLGDGILCFFGYSYDGEVTENQADQALRCAIDVQKQNLRRCIAAGRSGSQVLPFRIGINTGSVYIGDVGNEDRIDFTVIGHGVNYAQRLEAACEHHAITLSATTMDFCAAFNPEMPGFTKRQIHIKHHDELLEAIEFNPFYDQPALREEAFAAFRKSMNLQRGEQRWPVDKPELLALSSDFGQAQLLDFSASGFCVKIPTFLAKGVTFELNLSPVDPGLLARFQDRGLTSLKVEVRWGKTVENGYAHGLKVMSLTDDQMNHLFGLMRAMLSRPKSA